jgi:hypothetical protein
VNFTVDLVHSSQHYPRHRPASPVQVMVLEATFGGFAALAEVVAQALISATTQSPRTLSRQLPLGL